ncbi:MAG: gephyrin-like molybdotransferase Glp [Haloarculaceae archaeon]
MAHTNFEAVTQLDDAREQLREYCPPHGRTERCGVENAVGRVLATEIEADRAVPHYDRAAMDGYAVRAQDTFGASDRSPVTLETDSESVSADEAVQVHTGSAIPEGGDAVVMVEHTERRDGSLLVYDAVAGGENVAPAGEDVEAGQDLFPSGHSLAPSDITLLRATGQETVEVFERPRVSVLPTGEELVPAGETPAPGQIVETNGLLVSSLVDEWGGEAGYRDIVTDDRTALREAIENDLDNDIVVTIGGSSVGDRDLMPEVIEELGEIIVHGVAIKPGHPVGFGVVDETPVLMLPGYPVSCLINAVQFLRPALSWRGGTEPSALPATRARLETKLRSSPGERTFARVRLEGTADDESLPDAIPVRVSGAGVMSSVTLSDGWVEIPESMDGIAPGETVLVQQWE